MSDNQEKRVLAVIDQRFAVRNFPASASQVTCVVRGDNCNTSEDGLLCSPQQYWDINPDYRKQMELVEQLWGRKAKHQEEEWERKAKVQEERWERKAKLQEEAQDRRMVALERRTKEALLERENEISKLTETCSKLLRECEVRKQKQEELEDMIYTMNKDNIWAQHSIGNRAFGRRVSEVVQSAEERKAARERELLRQTERTKRELAKLLNKKSKKARELFDIILET